KQQFIVIAKKQKDNLRRLIETVSTTYTEIKNKRTLIIDDEADYASIGFKKTKKEIYEINTIAGQIDELRQTLTQSAFLQVTATPIHCTYNRMTRSPCQVIHFVQLNLPLRN